MKTFLQNQFQLNYPHSALFYKYEKSLRFEIGNPELYRKNKSSYYHESNKLAFSIINDIFENNDKQFHIIIRYYKNKRKRISKSSRIVKLINNISLSEMHFFKSEEANIDFDSKLIFSSTHCHYNQEVINKIIPLITNSDLGLNRNKTYYKVFFVSKTTNTLVHYYDDRGLDVISNDRKLLLSLYNKFNINILNYDRDKIESMILKLKSN